MFFSRIHLFDVATPLVYTFFVLRFRRGTSKSAIMALSFVMGLAVDIFANTPGVAATSMTLIGCLQPYVLESFLRREDDSNLQPSVHTLGFMRYLTYALILLSVYCFTYFLLYLLPGSAEWLLWFLSASSSLLLTLVIILAIELSRSK